MQNAEILNRKEKYLKVIYWTCFIYMFYYVIKHNFEYKLYSANIVMLPILLGYSMFYLLKKHIQDYFYQALFVFLLPSTMLIYMIWIAGGIKAPGVFWLSVLPMVGGILLNRKGLIIGFILTFGTISGFIILDHYHLSESFLKNQIEIEYEKIVNLVSFLIFIVFITYYFISNEIRFERQIQKNKEEIENLLRILLHDIANPLSVIANGIEIIKTNRTEEAFQRVTQRMQKNSQSLILLLNQVRRMKALDDGKADLNFRKNNIDKLIEETVESLEIQTKEKQIKIDHIKNPTTSLVYVDDILFKNIVLSNILSNALKFTPVGGKITISTENKDNQVILTIEDSGIGIPKNILKNIFNVNYKTTRKGTSGELGTGFGLPIVKSFIEKMNGQIIITSNEDAIENSPTYTKVSLVLPIE